MADPGTAGPDPGTGVPAPHSPLHAEAARRWAESQERWDTAVREIWRVREAAKESLAHARDHRPEHLPTVLLAGPQSEELVKSAILDYLDTLSTRRALLKIAMGRPAGAAAEAYIASILDHDRVDEEADRGRLRERVGQAMDKARPDWLFAPAERRTGGLHGPRVPKAPRKARSTVRAVRRRRSEAPGRGRRQT
jgi:hypothetical protein